jgi:hypothetical protein
MKERMELVSRQLMSRRGTPVLVKGVRRVVADEDKCWIVELNLGKSSQRKLSRFLAKAQIRLSPGEPN